MAERGKQERVKVRKMAYPLWMADAQVRLIQILIIAPNGMRPIALGHKHWMLIGNESAGPKVPAMLSVIETCRRFKIDLRTYLKDFLHQRARRAVLYSSQRTPLAYQKRKQTKPP